MLWFSIQMGKTVVYLSLLTTGALTLWTTLDQLLYIVVNSGATWRTFRPQDCKTKKNYPEKNFFSCLSSPKPTKFLLSFIKIFYYILGWNFLAPSLKNSLYFSTKIFLIFWDEIFQPQAQNTNKPPWRNFLYFSRKHFFPHFGITAYLAIK